MAPDVEPSTPLGVAEGYRLWAPTYATETVVSSLEERTVRPLMPSVAGRRLLDVGCGVGRRLLAVRDKTAFAVGADLVPQMLRTNWPGGSPDRVAADVKHLPFRDASFDVVWCRLVLGHVEHIFGAYRELHRVAAPGASLVVSDFHSAASAAGHRRTFRDAEGIVREVRSYPHANDDHVRAARASGWVPEAVVDAVPGGPEREFYERAGRIEQFDAERSLPLVMVLCLRR